MVVVASEQAETRRLHLRNSITGHLDGFDPLRVLAALSVVFSHAILLSTGGEDAEPFQWLTGEILGIYGVFIFFMLSGYLVTDSALRASGLFDYLLKRIRRIFPAFIAANVVGAVVIAPFFAHSEARAFLSSPETWDALVRALTFQDGILMFPDVSFYAAAHPGQETMASIVNGVLWTIPLELLCYLGVALLLAMRLLRPWAVFLLAIAVGFYCFRWEWQPFPMLGSLAFVAPLFVAGMAARIFLHRVPIPGWAALWGAAGVVLAATQLPGWSTFEQVVFPMLALWPMLWLGQHRWGGFLVRNPFGRGRIDPSYGIYIWGWPVQQLLLALTGPDVSPLVFTPLCLIAAYIAGVLSWIVIERPFLGRRRLVALREADAEPVPAAVEPRQSVRA